MDLNRRLLAAAYKSHMTGRAQPLAWGEWAESEGVDVSNSDRAFYELREKGLVEGYSSGRVLELTATGILQAEALKVADPALVAEHEKVRKAILRDLLMIREEHGPRGLGDWEEICTKNSLTRDLVFTDLTFLRDLGLLDLSSIGVQLTAEGAAVAAEILSKDNLESKWRQLHDEDINPQARGHALEKLLKEVADSEGWSSELNVRSSGEENDLILSQGFTYILVSCKWEKGKLGTNAVRDLRDRITARPGTLGMLVSVGGFSSEAVEWAEGRLESGVVLLMGAGDLESVFSGTAKLTDLLLSKHAALMTRRQVTFS